MGLNEIYNTRCAKTEQQPKQAKDKQKFVDGEVDRVEIYSLLRWMEEAIR